MTAFIAASEAYASKQPNLGLGLTAENYHAIHKALIGQKSSSSSQKAGTKRRSKPNKTKKHKQ